MITSRGMKKIIRAISHLYIVTYICNKRNNNTSVSSFEKYQILLKYYYFTEIQGKSMNMEECTKREGVQLDIGAFPRKRNIHTFRGTRLTSSGYKNRSTTMHMFGLRKDDHRLKTMRTRWNLVSLSTRATIDEKVLDRCAEGASNGRTVSC